MSSVPDERSQMLDTFLHETQMQTAATVLLEQAIAEQLRISVTDLHSANLLRMIGPMTAGKIAELTGLTTGAITGMLDRLEKIGFVRREIDPTDRRRIYVHAEDETMNTLVGPLYDSLARHSLAMLGQYSDEQFAFLLDHMRRNNALMMEETQRIRHVHAQKTQTASFDYQSESVTIPLGTTLAGHLILTEGAMRVTLGTAANADYLLSGQFEKVIPGIVTDSGVIRVIYLRGGAAQGSGTAALLLNDAIPWRFELSIGSATCTADLAGVRLNALDLKVVSSAIEIMLPAPLDIVPLRIAGEASTITLHCPSDTTLRVTQRRGAAQVRINGVGVEKTYESAGYADAVGRFEIDVSARLSPVNISLEPAMKML
jgi:DNA-binding MarR family transcriptional regulator